MWPFQPITFGGVAVTTNHISLRRHSVLEGYFGSGFRPMRYFDAAVSANHIWGCGHNNQSDVLPRDFVQEGFFWSGFRPIRFFDMAVLANHISGV
jgi:hypothetical protein